MSLPLIYGIITLVFSIATFINVKALQTLNNTLRLHATGHPRYRQTLQRLRLIHVWGLFLMALTCAFAFLTFCGLLGLILAFITGR